MSWDMNKKILTTLITMLFTYLSVQAENALSSTNPQKTFTQNEISEYMADVRTKIQNNWNNPELTEEGKAVLQFKLTNDGSLCDYDIIKSSGNKVFDEFAINTLKKSLPFKPDLITASAGLFCRQSLSSLRRLYSCYHT